MALFFVAIIIIAVGIYLGILYFQQSYADRIARDKGNLQQVEEVNLDKELAAIDRLNLTGESLTEFEKLDQDYRELKTKVIPELTDSIEQAKQYNAQYQFVKTRNEMHNYEQQSNTAINKIRAIKEQLTEIQQSADEHAKAIEQLRAKFKEMHKVLLADNAEYGDAAKPLEDRLADAEKEFDDFTAVSTSGDLVTSGKTLAELRKKMASLEELMEKIPPLQENLAHAFPEQLDEIEENFSNFTANNYAFSSDFPQLLKEIRDNRRDSLTDLKKLNITNVEGYDKKLSKAIDHAYDLLEQEYQARQHVEKQQKTLSEFIAHAVKQEHDLLIELDRIRQNYELTHGEQENAQELDKKLKAIQKDYDESLKQSSNGPVLYSAVQKKQERMKDQLTVIERRQKAIRDGVTHLWDEEKVAQQAVSAFDVQIHNMRRDVERLNLPGLKDEYLNFFFSVSDKIEQLDHSLNRLQINMDQISNMVQDTAADLTVLGNKTKKIIESSILTEQLLQYANRYRNQNEAVARAYEKATAQFEQQYDYARALDTIATALGNVAPGIYEQLLDEYRRTNRVEYQIPDVQLTMATDDKPDEKKVHEE